MTKLFKSIANFADTVNEVIGRVTAWLTTSLVILVCYDVAVRYIFNATQAWIMELEWHLFALIFLLAAGYALKHNRHVRVDLFYANYSKKDKAQTDLIGTLVFLIPWCIVIIVFASKFAYASFLDNEGSPNPGGLPARYLIKYSVVLGFTLLLLQAFGELSKSILALRAEEEK